MAHPNPLHPDEQLSVVEDLDPEIAPARGPGMRRDLFLGMTLLLAVVLFAGWQWWRQEYQSGQYRAGQEAAGRNEWEVAFRYFTEASGYNDADALAGSARQQIEERDRLYKSASEHADKEEWLHTLRDTRATARIQPGYRDLAALEGIALERVYSEAMSGTVAMRSGADPPGLYYRGAHAWIFLEKSDEHSNMLTLDDRGQIVYDVPGEDWADTPSLREEDRYSPHSIFKGRRLMLADLSSGEPKYAELALDVAYYTPLVAGNEGMWAGHFGVFDENGSYDSPIVRNTFFSDLAFQLYSDAGSAMVPITPSAAITAGTAIVSIDPDSNRYLVAEWTNAHTDGVGPNTIVNLYMVAAGETDRQLVYTHTGGGLQSAQISPDGRFVVVHTYTPSDVAYEERQATVVVDLANPNRTVTLRTMTAPKDPYGGTQNQMTSVFLRRGAFQGDLLLSIYEGDHTHIQLIDPAMVYSTTNYAHTDLRVQSSTLNNWVVAWQGEAGLVLAGQAFVSISPPRISTLTIIALPAQGDPVVHKVDANSYSGVTYARLDEKSILWTDFEYVSSSNFEPNPPVESAYSLPRSIPQGSKQQNTRLFTTRDIEGTGRLKRASFYLGDKLIAYTNGSELHARTYNGEVDLLLETGVESILANNRNDYYTGWMR